MNKLKAGYGRENINPKMGHPIAGYFKERYVEGFLDDLYANALAISTGNKTVVLVSIANCGVRQNVLTKVREEIAAEHNLSVEDIIIGSTHTHTGPMARFESVVKKEEMVIEYLNFLCGKIKSAVSAAIADLTEAKMGYGLGEAKNISFGRRYLMKDGTTQTNPGVNNPDIVKPYGEVDERVHVLRFNRVDGQQLVFVQFATHPDVVGGSLISADWPGLLVETVEKTLDNTKCIFFNGTQGDVNHVNVHPVGGDFNDMFNDFDNVARGYEHAKHMAYVVAGGVMQCYQKVNYVDVEDISTLQTTLKIPSNQADPADLPEAHRINDLHLAGRDDELPYKGMMLTTMVAGAGRMVRLENGPEFFEMPMTAFKVGPIAFISIPGEGFTDIGIELKKSDAYEMVIPLGISNGSEGYFPMMSSYEEGGYEAATSSFKAGVAEYMIEEGKKLINSLK